MLFLNKNNMFNKGLFLRIALCLFFVTSFLTVLLVAMTYKQIKQANQEVRFDINEMTNEVEHLYYEQGLAVLLEEYELTDTPIFDEHDMLVRFDHDELVFALRDQDNALITGAQSLVFTPGWHRKQYRYEEETIRVLGKGTRFEDGSSLMLQMPIGEGVQEMVKQLKRRIAVIVVFALFVWPLLTLVIGKHLTRAVNKITDELERVSKKPDELRLNVDSSVAALSELAMSLNNTLEQVSKRHRNMQTMSVGIAHDLKTPLSRVANRLQLMEQDIDDKASLMTHIDKATAELNSIVKTFTHLIRLNEIESGKRKLGFIKLNFSNIVSELADSYQPVFDDENKTLEVSIVDNVMCLGDGDLLSQLINNLLENALIYSERNAKVWIRLQSNESGALLQIGDSGPGIPGAMHEQVFERFYRADYSRNKPGNGLGLSIVKAICDLHDANICLLVNQAGTVFDITLPVETS